MFCTILQWRKSFSFSLLILLNFPWNIYLFSDSSNENLLISIQFWAENIFLSLVPYGLINERFIDFVFVQQ